MNPRKRSRSFRFVGIGHWSTASICSLVIRTPFLSATLPRNRISRRNSRHLSGLSFSPYERNRFSTVSRFRNMSSKSVPVTLTFPSLIGSRSWSALAHDFGLPWPVWASTQKFQAGIVQYNQFAVDAGIGTHVAAILWVSHPALNPPRHKSTLAARQTESDPVPTTQALIHQLLPQGWSLHIAPVTDHGQCSIFTPARRPEAGNFTVGPASSRTSRPCWQVTFIPAMLSRMIYHC